MDKTGFISFSDPNFFGDDYTTKYEAYRQNRIEALGNVQIHNIMRNASKITGLENRKKADLERMAVRTVKELFPVIDEVGINITAVLTDSISHNQLSPRGTPDYPKRVPQNNPELYNKVAKQKFLNALMQGAAVSMNSIQHMVKDRLDAVSPELVPAYDGLMKANEVAYFTLNDFHQHAIMSNRMGTVAGTNKVSFENKIPRITARAMHYVTLVHELVKGVYTYLALNAYTSEEEYYDITEYTDSIYSEIEDIGCGKMMIEVLRDYLLDNFDKYYEHPSFFEMFIVALSKLPADEFLSLMKGLIRNEPNKAGFEVLARNCYYDLKDFEKKKYVD
jgi:hypothetical protein